MVEGLRKATKEDVSAILDIAKANLADYQRYQATFWRRAGDPREQRVAYLESRLTDEAVVGYVQESDGDVAGFILASLVSAPPVYNPGGPVALIDDFALRAPDEWLTTGTSLLRAATAAASDKGAVIVAVVTGHQDAAKRAVLKESGYDLASEWHLRQLDRESTTLVGDDHLRPATVADLATLLELADQRRMQYQEYQPIFWRAAPDAYERQRPFLERTLRADSGVAQVYRRQGYVDGFVIGSLLPSPAIFRSNRVTCLIDDLCVATPESWSDVGPALLQAANHEARERGATQTAVICGHLDQPKREFLRSAGLVVSSEWWLKTS